MTTIQDYANQLFGQFKTQVMMLLNETADEFDARITGDADRKIYNDFTAAFGEKVLGLKLNLEPEDGQKKAA